jgi:trimethylamine--corrinoid protein Co-methyltransferase
MHSAGFLEGALGVSYAKWVQDAAQLEGFHRFFAGIRDEEQPRSS